MLDENESEPQETMDEDENELSIEEKELKNLRQEASKEMLDEMWSQNTLDHLVKVYRGEEQSNLHDAYIKIRSKKKGMSCF